MNISINISPRVHIGNRAAGKFGVGEVVDVGCVVTPVGSSINALGGICYRIKQGSGALTGENTGAGIAVFTASSKAETVKIAAFGCNDLGKELAVATLIIVAPTGLGFKRIGNIAHDNGLANVGFRGEVTLHPPGVSYENVVVREGEFKAVGTGCYAGKNNEIHRATAVPVNVIQGNRVNGLDTIHSGTQSAPWSSGRFEWNIPWQYKVGSSDWITFAYANHVQEINSAGVVSIGKYNVGLFSAKPSDPTSVY